MQVTVNRRTVLIGGAALAGLAIAGTIINLRRRALPREPGLVGHWTFDGTSGNAVLDASGLANDGLVVPEGLPDDQKWGRGEFAGSLSLSGSGGNSVRVAPSDSLNGIKTGVTVAAHVFNRTIWTPGAAGAGSVAIVQRQWRNAPSPDLFSLGLGVDSGVQMYRWQLGLVGSEAGLFALPSGQSAPTRNGWVHLAGTYDATKGEMALYVDGAEIGRRAASGDIRIDEGSFDRPLAIGAALHASSSDEASDAFAGAIDDVRLYDRALDAESIKTLADQAAVRQQVTVQ